MRRISRLSAAAAVVLGLLVLAAGCDDSNPRAASTTTPGDKPAAAASAPAVPPRSVVSAGGEPAPEPAVERGTLRLISLPAPQPQLPPAPGRETVMVLCATCHTPEYITLQPPLSRETWVAEVAKMRTTYSAPVPEDKVDEIVEYLVAVRGLKK